MNRCSADVVETSEVLDYLADQNALIGQRPNMLSPTTDAAP
jgi:hypothetical protein